jgi:glycogen operon protein
MDSLRYWVQEMHVDGFRFDLASALAREVNDVDTLCAFFDIIHQDPVLSQVKLIAEPWDVGQGGYQVGNFPVLWTEWNGRYRDCVRRFWKGDGGTAGEFATRLSGSSDLYQDDGRNPSASINFVTCHDGFTLRDLVSYNGKHNEQNGEDNRDGANHNDSWNCGAEGSTDEPAVQTLRARQQRNLLTTLLLSQGVPMLLAGDEIGHSQRGNNNAYCQDNDLTWLDWDLTAEQEELLRFVQALVKLRKTEPVFRRRRFFFGRPIADSDLKDLYWIRPESGEMTPDDWIAGHVRSLGMGLVGNQIAETDERGQRIVGDTFLLLFNAHHEPVEFHAGERMQNRSWSIVLDTNHTDCRPRVIENVTSHVVAARSVSVLRLIPRPVPSPLPPV